MADLLDGGADGLLLVPTFNGPEHRESYLARIAALPVPAVLIERRGTSLGDTSEYVCTHHEAGAYDAVRHLAALGHRSIGLVLRAPAPTAPPLIEGYRQAAAELGCATTEFEATRQEWSPATADRALAALRAGGATAAVCFGDRQAALLEGAARRAGLTVPDDLALVAYDDEIADLADIPLTAVAPPNTCWAAPPPRRCCDGSANPDRPATASCCAPASPSASPAAPGPPDPRRPPPGGHHLHHRLPLTHPLTQATGDHLVTDIRLGLIGAGAVGVLHAQAAETAFGVRVTAVCDLVEATARGVAGPLGAAVFTDHRALIASGTVDAVVVNTPHALHTAIVTDSAAAGLHVLVEKPMATNSAECTVMEQACADAGVTLFVGHIQHFLPPMVAARAALDADAIGELLAVSDWRSTDYRPGSRPAWFFDPAVSGGGVFVNIGTHCVDRLVWLAGRRVRAVSANAVHRAARSPASRPT